MNETAPAAIADLRVVVTVPGSPDRILAPNRRAHGYQKAAATARHRRDAFYAAVEAVCAIRQETVIDVPFFTGPVSVSLLVRWSKGERSKDLDSVAVCCKPYIDGIVDAGILANDSQVKRLTIEQERDDTGRGEVMIEVAAMTAARADAERGAR